ncbi:MAG: ROK family protein [Caldiserica bacterium]|nr:ROK family protein [Caldisericota bacterium]
MKKSNTAGRTVAGVDIGGTKVTFILWHDGSIQHKFVLPYAAQSSREFSDLILKGVADLRQRAADTGTSVMGTGIGCAGMVDQKRGVLRFSPNMPGLHDVALAQIVAEKTHAPAYLENDANCALFAEWASGVAVGHSNVVMFSVGTGVGGALILDGHLYVGHHGFAGEMGHIPMVDRGLLCGCGRHGCLETTASGTGIERYVRSALARGSKSLMTTKDAGSARVISRFAQNGDQLAQQAFKQAARSLGRAAGGIINILDPDMIVLGGGVAESGLLMDEMKRVAGRRSLPLLFEGVEFAMAHYRNDAAAVGAALLADQLLKGQAVYSI